MGRKSKTFLLTVASISGALAATQGRAESTPALTDILPHQFYVGMSGGMEYMSGTRSDSLFDTTFAGLGDPSLKVFANNQHFSSRGDIALAGMGGFLWKIPRAPFFAGAEFYLGKGNGSSLVSVPDYEDNLDKRSYRAEFKRKLFYGFLVRGGWNFWKEYFSFLSVGIDLGHFMSDRQIKTGLANPVGAVEEVKRTKKLSGFVWGIGIEKRIGNFCVGTELKVINYRRQNFSDIIPGAPGLSPNKLNFSAKPKVYNLSLRVSYLF